ncbi:hypothetical protein DH2020_032293 [Rehmannia glutinosa]|uniref:Uncharacterized protein n=1 Tax=Rehmannia glutinosa TaxID=99300 RepID=A0ABR0VGD7_REHGL
MKSSLRYCLTIRFQILRELIPQCDQKRDTASFLLERNSHWRLESFAGQPQTMKNGSGPGPAFPAGFDENAAAVPTTMHPGPLNPIEPDHVRDAPCRPIDLQTELPNITMGMPASLQATMPVSIANDGAFSHILHGPHSDAQSTECPNAADALNLQDELAIESGTISISSVYSQGLLNSLTQALQSTGVDLSQANISVQINLGKRAHRGSTAGVSIAKDHGIPMPSGNQPIGTFQDANNKEDLDQAQKRQRFE